MQFSYAESSQIVPEDVVLDENLKQIVMMKRQICHLETEGEEIDGGYEKESLLVCGVDTLPPVSQQLIQGSTVWRYHRNNLVTEQLQDLDSSS
jgi:hypothetical protein